MLILLLGDPDRVEPIRSFSSPRIICSAGRYGVTKRWSLRLQTRTAVATPC